MDACIPRKTFLEESKDFKNDIIKERDSGILDQETANFAIKQLDKLIERLERKRDD